MGGLNVTGSITVLVFAGLLLGSCVGGIMHFFFSGKLKQLYVFCGGILIGLLFFSLIPETLAEYELQGIAIGAMGGIVVMILLDYIFHHEQVQSMARNEKTKALLFLIAAIAIHNIPTGLALGSSFMDAPSAGGPLLGTIVFHQVPEGIALSLSIIMAGYNLLSIVMVSVFLAAALGLGTFFGMDLGDQSHRVNTLLMGGAVGTLGYVSLYEILWKSREGIRLLQFLIFSLLGLFFIRLYFVFL